jgi:peptidoglycan-associated lipoprotein
VKPAEPVTPQPQAEQPKEEPSVRFTDWEAVPQIKAIYFDYDSTDLSAEARATLKGNADFLAANPDYNVLVEGNCDERGTTEYNLALGQRRASAVRDYYGKLGVPLGCIGTISYGEEKPVDPGHTEAAWAKNRRAETKVRSK